MSSSAISNMTDEDVYRQFVDYRFPLIGQFKWRQVSVEAEPNLQKYSCAWGLRAEQKISLVESDEQQLNESLIQGHLRTLDDDIARNLMARKTKIHNEPMSAHWDKEEQVFISSFQPSKLTPNDIVSWQGAMLSSPNAWLIDSLLAITSPRTARAIKDLVPESYVTSHGIQTAKGIYKLIGHRLISDGNIFWLDPKKWVLCCTFDMPSWDTARDLDESLRLTNYAAFKCILPSPPLRPIQAIRVA